MWVQNALLGYFCALILKNYFNIWFQHPGIFQIAKFCANWICHNAKQTKSNVVPKCLIWVFLSFNFRKLFPYLVSATWNLSKRKVLCKKKKILKFGNKNAWLKYLWTVFVKIFLSYVKSTHSIFSKANFEPIQWILVYRPFFPKFHGSSFSESLGAGLGPFYEVYSLLG